MGTDIWGCAFSYGILYQLSAIITHIVKIYYGSIYGVSITLLI